MYNSSHPPLFWHKYSFPFIQQMGAYHEERRIPYNEMRPIVVDQYSTRAQVS